MKLISHRGNINGINKKLENTPEYKQPIKNSIAVMPEIYNDIIKQCHGICSDYVRNYKNER